VNTGAAQRRHRHGFPCPVCDGHAALPHGRGIRCAGFTLDFVTYCTRDQFAGQLSLEDTSPPAYKHHLFGHCYCGVEHGGPAPLDTVRSTATPDGRPVLAIATRGMIYERALALLVLRPEALADLTRRGLSAAQARDLGYRSIPRRGGEHQRFRTTLLDEFGEVSLRECPGFTDKNGRLTFWTASAGRDGYVVPYRDEVGRVTGLQMKVLGGRYLTAARSRLDSVYHVAGGTTGTDLYLTEGGTKANVAHALGGITVFAVAGQSLMPSHVEAIQRLSPRHVIIALDEEDNVGTDQARERWQKLLADAGLSVYRATWEGADVSGPKGLDDLFHAGGQPRIRPVYFNPPELGISHRPYNVDEPGFVERGSSLKEARERTTSAIDEFVRYAPKNAGKAQLVASSPGVGKSHALAQAVRTYRTSARILVGTKALAAELATAHGYVLISGRNRDNCDRYELTARLGAAGHAVARLACGTREAPRCPWRETCGYFAQFQQPGPRVAATEQLFNPNFLRGGTVLVLDDAELMRSLVSRCMVSIKVIARALEQLKRQRREPARQVLLLLQHAIIDAPEHALTGAAVWDHLAKTAARYSYDLAALLRALPKKGTLPEPQDGADGYVTEAAVDAVPPATILLILDALRAELEVFESNSDFNSALRLGAHGIEVRALRKPVPDQHGVPIAPEMALLVLDATPVDALVEHVMRDHKRLDAVHARVRLPENVTVVQYASTSNGHMALTDERNLKAVSGEVAQERVTYPVGDPTEEAVIVFKAHRRQFVEMGFAEAQVLTFGSARGTNSLIDVQRLHVVGRPMPSSDELVFMAQVIHHDEAPISAQVTFVSRTYGGQREALDLFDFEDPRVAALLRSARDDEMTQVIHRSRLLTLQSQLKFEPGDQRLHVRVVLHTNHVLPGLRVDELHVGEAKIDVNQQRHQDAVRRIHDGFTTLSAEGKRPTNSAVARWAGAQRGTVSKVLGTGVHTLKGNSAVRTAMTHMAKDVGTPVHTVKEDLIKGMDTLPQPISSLPPSHSPTSDRDTAASAREGYAVCAGACGASVPIGQKCSACAALALGEWLDTSDFRRASNRRRISLSQT